jgi:hypothetical protein
VSTPIGHTIIGLALARRLGARSTLSLGTAIIVANLADIDIALGFLLRRDPWQLHRRGTHTLGFLLGVGGLAGAAGLVSAGSPEAKRHLLADASRGAIIAASHVVLDALPRPRLSTWPCMPRQLRRQVAGMSVASWLLDLIGCGTIAWAIRPRARVCQAVQRRSEPAEGAWSHSICWSRDLTRRVVSSPWSVRRRTTCSRPTTAAQLGLDFSLWGSAKSLSR